MIRICRICLARTEYYIELGTTEKSLRSKLVYCVPEMDKSVSKDAVICRTCAHSLEVTYMFLKKCLQTEQKFNEIKNKKMETQENYVSSDNDVEIIEDPTEEAPAKRQKIDMFPSKQSMDIKQNQRDLHENKTNADILSIDENLRSILKTNDSIFNFEYHSEKVIIKQWKCDICESKFTNEKDLEGHKKSHKELDKNRKDKLNCQYCQKHFSRLENLLFHEKMHNKSNLFQCNNCSEMFDSPVALMSHLEFHIQKDSFDPVGECEMCGKYFHVKCLDTHTEEHSKESRFNCMYCSSSFDKRGFLIYHLKLHTEEEKVSKIGNGENNCKVCNIQMNLEKIQTLKVEKSDTVDTKVNTSTTQTNNVAAESLIKKPDVNDQCRGNINDSVNENSISGALFLNNAPSLLHKQPNNTVQLLNSATNLNSQCEIVTVQDISNTIWVKQKDNIASPEIINIMKKQVMNKIKKT